MENSIKPPGFLGIFLSFAFCFVLLCWVFVAVHGFSLGAASRGDCLVVVHGVLDAVARPVADHGPWSTRASVVVARGFSRSAACGILPDK